MLRPRLAALLLLALAAMLGACSNFHRPFRGNTGTMTVRPMAAEDMAKIQAKAAEAEAAAAEQQARLNDQKP